MKIDVTVLPGLLLLTAELLTLAAVGYVVARAALRQTNDALALAQGLVIGLALWGLTVNFLLHLFPGLAGALAGWIVLLAIGVSVAWPRRNNLRIPPRTLAGFILVALRSSGSLWQAASCSLFRTKSPTPRWLPRSGPADGLRCGRGIQILTWPITTAWTS